MVIWALGSLGLIATEAKRKLSTLLLIVTIVN